jgi:hypothetical protein
MGWERALTRIRTHRNKSIKKYITNVLSEHNWQRSLLTKDIPWTEESGVCMKMCALMLFTNNIIYTYTSQAPKYAYRTA